MQNGRTGAGVTRALTLAAAALVAGLTVVSPRDAAGGAMTATQDPTSAASAMPTLQDIHSQLTTGALPTPGPGTYTKRTGAFADPTSISSTGTMKTLQEIFDALPAKDLSKGALKTDVCDTQAYWGLRNSPDWGDIAGSRDCTAPNLTKPADQTTNEDTAKAVALTVVDDPAPGGAAKTLTSALTWQAASSNTALLPVGNIALSYAASTWTATLTPAPDASGASTVTLTVRDGAGNAAAQSFQLTVSAVNDAPVGVDDRYTAIPGAALTVAAAGGVLANDTDGDSSHALLTATVGTLPAHGTLLLNANGGFTYQHDGGAEASDSFTYAVTDGTTAATVRPTVTILLSDMNAAPTLSLTTPDDCRHGGTSCTQTITKNTATLTDVNGHLGWMKVEITSGALAGDVLGIVSTPAGITQAAASGGVLLLAGNATPANYLTALKDVTLTATVSGDRTIRVTVGDAAAQATGSVTMTVRN